MEKPYYSANMFYRNKFNKKVIKVALNGGFTCPNRDGFKGAGGCIFCSAHGSGDFAGNPQKSITEQFYEGKAIMDKKWKNGVYMAYFQAFTNTYASVEVLKQKFTEALNIPEVAALSIATRPDCLEEEKIKLIESINAKKYTCVELGLQTSNPASAKYINRCFTNNDFKKAVSSLNKTDTVAHIILGLPGETKEDMLSSVKFAADCGVKGIKLQLLHVLKNTVLAQHYIQNRFQTLTLEQYTDAVVSCIEILPPHIVIHRITGDGAGAELIAPLYSKNKKLVLNTINKAFLQKNTWQGKYCRKNQSTGS